MDLSYQNQINVLKNKYNLSIQNYEFATIILKTIGFYRLSGYGLEFLKENSNNEYINGTNIQTLYNLYCFDSKLRNILMHILEILEIQLKEQISNFIATKYGIYGYLEKNNFSDNKNSNNTFIYDIVMQKLNKEIERNSKLKRKKLYAWEAIDLFTFGSLSNLYTILKNDDKKHIASLYNTTPKYLKNWILVLVELRNICAHHVMIYNNHLKQTPYLYKENMKYRKNFNTLFPVLLIIKRMLNSNKTWDRFRIDLYNTIEEYTIYEYLKNIGFPSGWNEIL